MKVAIIGAGPAGLAAYEYLKNYAGNHCTPTLFEAGLCINDRIALPASSEVVINGIGGAGLYSDRKLSTFPAGTGQLTTNPYELRETYDRIIRRLQDVLNDSENTKLAFDNLMKTTQEFIGGNTVSSESLDRQMASACSTFNNVKLYNSVVLSNFDDAVKLLDSFKVDDNQIFYGVKVLDVIHEEPSKYYSVTFNHILSGEEICLTCFDYVLFAMGRFGNLGAEKFSIFQPHKLHFKPLRLEFGVRVDINSHEPLRNALLKLTSDSCADPKLKLTQVCMIQGRSIAVEFRTFCVCLPHDQDKTNEGYVVKSCDVVTGLCSYSGSSSYDELTRRPHVVPGSNLGIMMRIVDSDLINDLGDMMNAHQQDSDPIMLDIRDATELSISLLAKIIPRKVCYPFFVGLQSMIHKITGSSVSGLMRIFGPCYEGTGYYVDVDSRTYQQLRHPNAFVAGDMVGHTRGLLQAFATGDIAAKSMATKMLEDQFRKAGSLMDYQSLHLPAFAYNKVILDKGSFVEDMGQRMSDFKMVFDSIELPEEHYQKILSDMFKPKYTGQSAKMGVLYEVHHFFLDATIYKSTGQLHYISQSTMMQYIAICNTVECNKMSMANKILTWMRTNPKFVQFLSDETFEAYYFKTFADHIFKACILALRTRDNIDTRDNFTDIPVMQSAFKFCPVRMITYQANGDHFAEILHEMEYCFVAMLCAFLDSFFNQIITKFDLKLLMVRNKIETQEPSVESLLPELEPKYLECHVKVSISKVDSDDGSTVSPPYHIKKKIIQDLASLFEGPCAMVDDIFNVMGVSINLQKHPDHGQQFFLTFRTESKKQMAFIRAHFSAILYSALELVPKDSELRKHAFAFYTDAEFVIYDDNRDLDLPWFPLTQDFLSSNYEDSVRILTSSVKKILMITSNKRKLQEIRAIVEKCAPGRCYVGHYFLEDLESQGVSLKTNVCEKVHLVANRSMVPCVAESTGLAIEGTMGYPGAHTKLLLNHVGKLGLVRLANGQVVNAQTSIAFFDGLKIHRLSGSIPGTLAEPLSDDLAETVFGWDDIFIPSGAQESFAEMPSDYKNLHSMRSVAFTKFADRFLVNE